MVKSIIKYDSKLSETQKQYALMKKSLRKIALFFMVWTLFATSVFAQDSSNPLAFLQQKCPKLTELYRDELGKYPVHYIFAIDVSGTMDKYQADLVPALSAFFDALPDGDRVTVIPFGTEAMDLMDFSGRIDQDVRRSLKSNINMLYKNPNFPANMKQCTNVEKAVSLISKKINLTSEYKANVVMILTDFRNDDGKEHKLSESQLAKMDEDFAAAAQNVFTRCVALDLATAADKAKPGYCLNQLKEKVFYSGTSELEIVALTNPGPVIRQWFEELKREIMVMKMRAVIDDENRLAPANLKTEIDIDGNVLAHISWTPSKLYPKIKIDSTFVMDKNFYFKNDTTQYQVTLDTVLDLELGKIKNKKMFFHHLKDSLALGLDLPTDYDNELAWLKMKKPLPDTTEFVDKTIFTFFLPFWLCCVILAIILIYIIMVIMAIKRNISETFKGTVDLSDNNGRPIGDTANVRVNSFSIGSAGTGDCAVSSAKWNIAVKKKTYSPLRIFKRPCFEWKRTEGYAKFKKKQSGLLSRYGNGKKVVNIECGSDMDHITHTVTIKLKNK